MNPMPTSTLQDLSTVLRADQVTKDFVVRKGLFRKKDVYRALEGITVELRKNSIIGLVGDSGGGKTTFAKILSGLMTPTAGQVFLADQPLYGASSETYKRARKEVRYIFQNVNAPLNPRMKILSTLEEPIDVHTPMTNEERRNRIEEVAREVDLPLKLLHKYPHALSGGEKRRVALARALVCRPSFIIADEPTAGLDADLREGLLALFRTLRDIEKIGVLIVSHDFNAMATVCDDVRIIVNGRLV